VTPVLASIALDQRYSHSLYPQVSINTARMTAPKAHLIAALAAADASTRLKAALAIGSNPEPDMVDTLVERCAIEPDFYVRDMLTWALTRLPPGLTVPRLLEQLRSEGAQARSQALHTLSKIKDPGTFHAIAGPLLRDLDDEVARSAWRAAVILVPDGEKSMLAEQLVEQFGRGSREVQLSLSRALVALGAAVVEPLLRKAMDSATPEVRAHARATEQLLREPGAGSGFAVREAKRLFVLGKDRKA
jgi:HEAT repeat protein